jgi:hypothetical protein
MGFIVSTLGTLWISFMHIFDMSEYIFLELLNALASFIYSISYKLSILEFISPFYFTILIVYIF